MKMNKKQVFTLALAVCLIAILSMGTLAWFSDEDSIKNDFMIAGSDDDTPDEIFSVDVWENTPDGDKDQDGYKYEDILPGDQLKKEVYVENTGYYSQYIRVTVTVNNANAWIAALGNGYDLGTIFEGHDETLWTRMEVGTYNSTDNTYTMVYYLNKTLAANETACLFETVKIPSKLTQKDMVFVGAGFKLTVVADAVQTENLGIDTTDNINDAYQAFQVVEDTTNS